MALLETLTLALAPAVAKAILKLWLPEKSIALNLGDGVIDALKKCGANFLTARAIDRLFQDLASEMADRLTLTIQIEFPRLPESDQEAAALTVAVVFQNLNIPDAIVRTNINAIELEALIQPDAIESFKKLGGDAETLAQLMLRECCAYAVSLAGKLPDFQTVVSRELLKRDSEILTELKRVLDAVTAMRTKATGNEANANFDVTYRRTLVQRLDRMQLFGVKVASGSLRELELSVAYVTLASNRSGQNRDVNTSLAGVQRAVIRGEAGSGKTTLLQWMAVRAANRDFPEVLGDWNDRLPLYVALRHYKDRPFPLPKEFMGGAAANIADLMPNGWVQDALGSGALLLLDGLDEVPMSRRRELVDWLRALTEDFPQTVYVLSSRPAALDAHIVGGPTTSILKKLGFEEIILEPMSLPDSESLVSQWHRAVSRDTTDVNELGLLETYEKTLIRALHERPAIRNLASSPLLCGMICVLNWDRKQQLPDSRIELYGLALESLLERRDNERGIQAATLVALDKPSKEALLDGVALWMMRNGLTEAEETDVRSQIEFLLQRLPAVRDRPEDVLQELLERSGVVRRPSTGTVDFIHRTFLEYMAARAAVRGGDLGFLAKQAAEENWRETIVFAAGHAQGRQRDQLIEKLLQTPLFSFRARSVDADVTAACCLETAASNLDPALLVKLRARAEALFPPKNQNYARILAPAAQLDPNLLMGHSHQEEDVIAACIRCASIVGGERMLEVVEGYATAPGEAIWSELILAWTAFNPDEFRERVILKRGNESFGSLKLENMDEDTLKCLQILILKGAYDKSASKLDEALQRFSEDRILHIGSDGWIEYQPTAVSKMTSLFGNNDSQTSNNSRAITITDAQRISAIRSLKSLSAGIFEPGALQIISKMPELKRLSYAPSGSNEAGDLSHSSSLTTLNVSGLNNAAHRFESQDLDLRELSNCASLSTLEVSHFRKAKRILLPNNAQLKSLKLVYVPAATISQLHLFQGLSDIWLHVDELPAGELDLSNFGELDDLVISAAAEVRLRLPPSLTTLTLFGAKRVTIANITALINVRVIALREIEKFDDIQELLEKPSLTYVSIDKETRSVVGPIPERWNDSAS